MKLVAGPSSIEFTLRIAKELGVNPIKIEHKFFPDKENYIRVPEQVKGEKVILVQGMHPPQDIHLVQTLLAIDTLIDLGAESVELVSPYIAYARQDRRFLEGEAVSFKTILKTFHKLGLKKLYTVNIHCPWIVSESPMEIVDLRAETVLAKHLEKCGLSNPVIVSVGKRGLDMARMVAEVLNVEYAAARSERDKVSGTVKVELNGIPGKEVVIVDDIISTGGTMIELIKQLKKKGFTKIFATCIHALLVNNADEKIFGAGAERLIASDTVPNKYAEFTVTGLIAQTLKKELDVE